MGEAGFDLCGRQLLQVFDGDGLLEGEGAGVGAAEAGEVGSTKPWPQLDSWATERDGSPASGESAW